MFKVSGQKTASRTNLSYRIEAMSRPWILQHCFLLCRSPEVVGTFMPNSSPAQNHRSITVRPGPFQDYFAVALGAVLMCYLCPFSHENSL